MRIFLQVHFEVEIVVSIHISRWLRWVGGLKSYESPHVELFKGYPISLCLWYKVYNAQFCLHGNIRRIFLRETLLIFIFVHRNCWNIPRTGLYWAEGSNRPFLVLKPYISRTPYLPRSSKYCRDTAVANANGVLVRLICDGSGPRYIRLCLVLL